MQFGTLSQGGSEYYQDAMLDWLKRYGSITHREVTVEPEAPKPDGARMAGQYRSLYKFLEHRYSNTVALTFGQIEDLLGFPLPERARTDREWWTAAPGTTEQRHSQAWIQASMTAKPNLFAQNVIFERAP